MAQYRVCFEVKTDPSLTVPLVEDITEAENEESAMAQARFRIQYYVPEVYDITAFALELHDVAEMAEMGERKQPHG